jgi:sorbitol-6-phosphate 2-dehydrogenase
MTNSRSSGLKDKSCLVTGAAQGLGEAIAERLAREGAKVALADVNFEKVSAVAERLKTLPPASGKKLAGGGARFLSLRIDVTSEEEVSAGIDKVVAEFGSLDLLVSNAGILQAAEITDFEAALWRKVIEVNLVGYFMCAKHAARVMIPQKSGVIIQINSKSGKKGSFRSSAYAASKFGGIGLTQSLALELAPYNIRVNAICPGNLLDSPLWVDSLYEQYAKKWGITVEEVKRKYAEQVPLGRGCSYDDITNVLVFLASEQASYMTGQAINVTGGQQMD